MYKKVWLFLFIIIPLLSGDGHADEVAADKIWRSRDRTIIPISEFVNELRTTPRILIGEVHGVKAHQDREAFLIRALADQERYPDLVLEMLDREGQGRVETFRRDHPEQATGLGEALDWTASGWPSFTFYQPVFEAAFAAKLKIIGGDIPRADPSNTPVPGSTDPAVLASWRDTMRAARCGLADENSVAAYRQIERDRGFADAVAASGSAHGSLLIAGLEHVRRDRGVPRYLKDGPSAVVALIEIGDSGDPESYLPPSLNGQTVYDYVWFTPRRASETSCDRLRRKGLIQ
ncbi:ChaN family lipoprotein [Labrys neptuniae]